MEALNTVERIVRDLLVFVVAMSVVLAALLVIISRLPDDNPLKRILVALSYRVGATAAAGMPVIPATPIPGLDAVVDIGAPLAPCGSGGPSSATRGVARPGNARPDGAAGSERLHIVNVYTRCASGRLRHFRPLRERGTKPGRKPLKS